MSVNPAPLPAPKPQFELASGEPAVGNLLFFYVAGTVNTKQNTFTDSTGLVPNPNPIVLNSLGEPPNEIWFQNGISYKVVYAPAGDADPPSSPIWTIDNLRGINDTSLSSFSEWVSSGLTPTFIGTETFSVPGDQTDAFHLNRRLKFTVASGTVYGSIVASSFGAGLTTVIVNMDAAQVLDSGLSQVDLSILTANVSAVPAYYEPNVVMVFGARNDGVTDASVAIVQANTAVGAGGELYFLPGTYLIDNDITITCAVRMAPGAMFSVATGNALTIDGRIYAGRSRIFGGSGNVVIGGVAGSQKTGYPEWWGFSAGASGVVNRVALQLAMDALRDVELDTGAYALDDQPLQFTFDGTTVRGQGRDNTVLQSAGVNDPVFENPVKTTVTREFCSLIGMRIEMSGAAAGSVVDWSGMSSGVIEDVWVTGQSIAGVVAFQLGATFGVTNCANNRLRGLYWNLCAVGISMLDGTSAILVQDCRGQVSFATGNNMLLFGTAAGRVANITILDCAFQLPGATVNGINVFQNVDGVTILGCGFVTLASGIIIGATSTLNVYAPFHANYFSGTTTNIANTSPGASSSVRGRASIEGSSGNMIGTPSNLTCVRSATGIYAFTFAAALPDAAYTIAVSVTNAGGFLRAVVTAKSASGFTVLVEDTAGTDTDPDSLDVTAFHAR